MMDDGMFDEFASDAVPELENTPVNDELETLARHVRKIDGDVQELLSILRPLHEVIQSLPDAMAQITPLMNGLKDSPVLKMLGIRIP